MVGTCHGDGSHVVGTCHGDGSHVVGTCHGDGSHVVGTFYGVFILVNARLFPFHHDHVNRDETPSETLLCDLGKSITV